MVDDHKKQKLFGLVVQSGVDVKVTKIIKGLKNMLDHLKNTVKNI